VFDLTKHFREKKMKATLTKMFAGLLLVSGSLSVQASDFAGVSSLLDAFSSSSVFECLPVDNC
jgi:hypothetical protein